MVTKLRKQINYPIICTSHQVVWYEQSTTFAIKGDEIRQPVVKFNIRIVVKYFLLFTITIHYPIWWRCHYLFCMLY